MKHELNLKKTLIILLALVVLFVPTYAAIACYYAGKDDADKPEAVVTLTVKDPNGNTYTATKDNDLDGLFAMFTSMCDNSTGVSQIPDSISGTPFLLATFSTDDGEKVTSESYKYYFSTNASECYALDPSSKAVKLNATMAKTFLGTSYSMYLYKESTPPQLLNAAGEPIAPAELKWYYLTAGNTYQLFSQTGTELMSLRYDTGSSLGLRFSSEPDTCIVKAYDGSDLLFDCKLSNMPAINLTKSTTVSFVLTAEWLRTEGCDAYGTATYRFSADFKAPSVFKINSGEICHGDFVVISGMNVEDPSAVKVTSQPALNCEPRFFAEGDLVHSIIPISYGTVTGEYKLTVEYGVSSAEFTVNVKDYKYGYKSSTLDITSNMIKTLYTDANVAAYDRLVAEICAKSETLRYFTGTFTDYQQKGTLQSSASYIRLGFGRNVQLKNAAGVSFEHTGVDFEVPANVSVPAINAGKVVYSGNNEILGVFVVIDHGFGLKSWYAHLSVSEVSVGDIVTKDQSIGKTGKTGFTLDNRIHLGVTVYDIPIAPYLLYEKGVVFPVFEQ
jgi:hypothetical protein